MGSVDVLAAPTEQVKFMEDMKNEVRNTKNTHTCNTHVHIHTRKKSGSAAVPKHYLLLAQREGLL